MLRLKKMSMIVMSFMLIFISAFVVSGYTDWLTWGNAGAEYTGTAFDFPLFASNNPYGSVNLTTISYSSGFDYTPLIDDFDLDSYNEIVTVSAGVMSAYDNRGQLTDTLLLNGSICGSPCTANLDDDTQEEIAVMMYYGVGIYNLYILKMTAGKLIINRQELSVSISEPSCHLFCGDSFSFDNRIYMPYYADGDMYVYDYDTDSDYDVTNPYNLDVNDISDSDYALKGGISAGLFRGTDVEICMMSDSDASVMLFDTFTETYTKKVIYSQLGTGEDAYCSITNIGDWGGADEIIIQQYTGASSVVPLRVYDSSLTIKLNTTISDITAGKGIAAVGDFNNDAKNEMCICDVDSNNIRCWDSIYNNTWNLPIPAGECSSYIGIGEFATNNSYKEFLTDGGIYQYNGTNLSKIMDLGLTAKTGSFIISKISSKTSLINEIMFGTASETYLFLSQDVAAVCSNSICELGENIYNCPADCLPLYNPNETAGTLLNGHTCIQNSDCISGVCSAGICIGKTGGATCVADSECASGDCDAATGVCTQQDMVDSIDSSIELFGFRSVGAKMLFAFMCIIIITIGGMTTGARLGGMFGAVLAGMISFVFSLIGVVIIFSWIGVWVLFITLFLVISVVGVSIYWSSGSGG